MITTKFNGNQYFDLNENIIKTHINNQWVIAFVTRELSFKKEKITLTSNETIIEIDKEFIDDITEEEIQAGTRAIKDYCLANNNMSLYFEYLLAISKENEKLSALKEKKKYEIQIKRDEALQGGLIYKEHTFQTREKDKLNINGAVTNLMLDMQSGLGSIKELIWIDMNDEKVSFTPNEFLDFASKVAFHTQEITFKANVLKEKIEKAQNEEELDLISWENKE
ncbi:hypothetical protein AJM72_00955 [Campylobacter jejuni]|uniref:DUF4376 domain-containing protein n=1 Tax=Campylobacter jejuni TaxID=197 RepID=UPI0008750D3B|nr:DUF4376 domain-containing protein [Campylobacter jejuni]OEV68722.1 hypothetical protein AJM72_00955 [Campylobacter jejuni]OEW51064.1 hypothetical protein AJM74_04220 [Campylobacter jejuni]OEW61938.1 hypothetical protein AJM81_00600 [Campylobacter jejuni]OEX75927.1 hypothetical protein A0K60_03535 [Campylobacter jejuni]